VKFSIPPFLHWSPRPWKIAVGTALVVESNVSRAQALARRHPNAKDFMLIYAFCKQSSAENDAKALAIIS